MVEGNSKKNMLEKNKFPSKGETPISPVGKALTNFAEQELHLLKRCDMVANEAA